MPTSTAYGDRSPHSFWPRVREFAVPPAMIETATARRNAGDWAGACAAARVDIDLDPRAVARAHGRELAARVRADLRRLAPDLLRWHLPRIAPDGLLRPGLTVSLARYDPPDRPGAIAPHLVVRTPPAWADAGQRVALALWDGSRDRAGARHPHPRPDRRFRLDLHRHLWDAGRAPELRTRCGADAPAEDGGADAPGRRPATGRWAAEAAILLGTEGRAEGRSDGRFTVRLGTRRRLLLELRPQQAGGGAAAFRAVPPGDRRPGPVPPELPEAATWVPPDLDLLRAGLVDAGRLHPLVAEALAPGAATPRPPAETGPAGAVRTVDCRGAEHRIGMVDGTLAPLDHDPVELRREELLAALSGTPLPCLRVIDEAHRNPQALPEVRARLAHGDTAGAIAAVEGLLGPGAVLRDGALREALAEAARRRIAYGLFRAGLDTHGLRGPWEETRPGPRARTRPRHALAR
ncbi:hypothetical protein [Streptomyces sp. NPDC005805]|uniref:hypothetical protein n=1 Tax=Streptomyces sp. NPDC005805 TaxID=3157068 RepID=UPI0033EBD467